MKFIFQIFIQKFVSHTMPKTTSQIKINVRKILKTDKQHFDK